MSGEEFAAADTGILSGTCLNTHEGPRAVENLRVGDFVQTFDDGLQQIRSIRRSWLRPNAETGMASCKVVWIDGGAEGNSTPLLLLPGQPIMIESDMAERVFGDPFPVVTADTLIGTSSSEYVSMTDPVEIFTLTFDSPQLVYCAGGALVWFDGSEEDQQKCVQGPRYEIFDGRLGQLLARAKDVLPQNERRSQLRNFYLSEAGAVSVDFVILTAAAAGLGAVMLSIIGPSGVDLAQSIGEFLANKPLVTY